MGRLRFKKLVRCFLQLLTKIFIIAARKVLNMSDNNDDLFTWSEKQTSFDDDDNYLEDEVVSDGKAKLDIWDELREADMGNKQFYANLTPELQKQFSPLVAMRWFSICPDNSAYRDYILQMTNEMLNIDFFSLAKHPELQWKLLTLCGVGKSIRRGWIPMTKRSKRNIGKVGEFMLQWYPSANDMELELLTKNLSRDDFEHFAKSTGCTDQELKEVLKAFDVERGIEPVKEKAKPKAKRKA
jgi:hypothetical protein